MARLLSVKQFAALALGQAKPPWHLGYLNWLYSKSTISLKSAIAELSATQAVVFVNAGTYSGTKTLRQWLTVKYYNGVDTLSSYTEDQSFTMYWYWNSLGLADQNALQAMLKPNGVSISYFSPADHNSWDNSDYVIEAGNVIGLVGTYADLVSLNVKQIPADPSTWTSNDLGVASKAGFLLAGFAPTLNFRYKMIGPPHDYASSENWMMAGPNPYALPLAALYPGVSSDTVGTGLLGIVGLNQGVSTTQFMVGILATTRRFLLDIETSKYAMPLPQAIQTMIASITSHQAWVKGALNTVLADAPATKFATQPGVPALTISEVTYELQDGTGTTFTTSALTLNADGTVTGGVTPS
jgi:hypothetical protein